MAFITSYLSSKSVVLEVGCGEGHVALELLKRGHYAIGVDSNKEVVAQARARGIFAEQASWPEFECPPVDAVAFTRSLHHINPVAKAVGRARELLRPVGTLLVEDFAFDKADEVTINWFREAITSHRSRAMIAPVPETFVTELLDSRDLGAIWHQHHDELEIHTMATMTQAIAEYFVIQEIKPVPYLYRYLIPVLPETPEALVFVEEVFQEEASLGEHGEIVLIGRRIVGSPRKGAAGSPPF